MSMMVWSLAPLSGSSVTKVWRVSCQRLLFHCFVTLFEFLPRGSRQIVGLSGHWFETAFEDVCR
jgi:hypothetical protein